MKNIELTLVPRPSIGVCFNVIFRVALNLLSGKVVYIIPSLEALVRFGILWIYDIEELVSIVQKNLA